MIVKTKQGYVVKSDDEKIVHEEIVKDFKVAMGYEYNCNWQSNYDLYVGRILKLGYIDSGDKTNIL